MKIIFIVVTLFWLTSICGCSEKGESTNSIQRSLFSIHGFDLPTFSKKCLTYTFEDGREFQSVQINWLSKDTIEFNLTADWMPCVFEQKGVAVLKGHSSDRDKQNQGNKSFQEYIVLDEGQLKAICILFPRKAKIEYDYGDMMDECDPDASVLMHLSDMN